MKTFFYSIKKFEKSYLLSANKQGFDIGMTEKSLSPLTVEAAAGYDIISVFTADDVSGPVLEELYKYGVRFIATRAAGYDNIDLNKAKRLGIRVANVPGYSPYAIAEYALGMMLALNRKLITADKQVHRQDFTVDNLIGFDLHGKTIGIIGTGKIGGALIRLLSGFGCRLLGYDIHEDKELVSQYGLEYVPLPILCREANIISIHTCLTPETKYIIGKKLISLMQEGVMLINTSRGACVNTADVLHYLENGHIGYLGMDVYENEKGVFFYDWSGKEINDDLLKKLLGMPNVLLTPHQAFATKEALLNIAQTTFHNIECWTEHRESENELFPVTIPAYEEDQQQ